MKKTKIKNKINLKLKYFNLRKYYISMNIFQSIEFFFKLIVWPWLLNNNTGYYLLIFIIFIFIFWSNFYIFFIYIKMRHPIIVTFINIIGKELKYIKNIFK